MILQKEVFFIETLDNIPQEKLTHLKAVFFCRPTEESVSRICQELADPKFASYNLCKPQNYIDLYYRFLEYLESLVDAAFG